ncbi:MAG: hypothetical protein AB1467_06660 [Candidatus Diapherotrites archaeon]
MTEKIEGTVTAVSQQKKSIQLGEIIAAGKAKDYLPRKGDKVELTLDEQGKVLFCKLLGQEKRHRKKSFQQKN